MLLALAMLAVGATAARVRRVASAIDADPKALAVWVRRKRERVESLARAIEEASPLCPLCPLARALAEPDPRVRAASCNEALGDLSADVSWGEAIPDAALRACAFGTLLAAAAVLISQDELGPRLLEVLAIGGGGALAVLDLRRMGAAYATRWRVGLDAWVAASVSPDEVDSDVGKVVRRNRR